MDWPALAASMQNVIIGSALAEVATFRAPWLSTPLVVRAIYQRPPIETSDGGITYKGAEHRVTVRASDLPDWADRGEDLTIEIRGIELRFVDSYPDGSGFISIECRRVPSC